MPFPVRRVVAALALLLVPTGAVANTCMALWIERNGYLAERGYCFSGMLGREYFGTAGCVPTASLALPRALDQRMDEIRRQERQLNCAAQKERWTVSDLRAVGRVRPVVPGPARPPLPVQAAPAETRTVQEALRRLGHYQGVIDGVAGPGTRDAVSRWQAQQGAAPTGVLTQAQRSALLGPAGGGSGGGAGGGIVVPLGGGDGMPDFLLVAALARLPDFARHAPLRALMAEGRLSGFFAYAPDAASDPDAVARIAAEVARVAPPVPDRITFTLPAGFNRVDQALAGMPGPITAPVRARADVMDGFRIAPFAAVPLLGGAVRLDLELEGAPRLGDVLLSPQEAEAARLRGRFGSGTIRVEVEVGSLGTSADGLGIRLAGRVARAEFVSAQGSRGGPPARHVYRAAAGASLPPIRDFGELYETMAHLGRREGPAAEARTRVPERLDVQAPDAAAILALRHASARLATRPGLLDDFERAAPAALPLLTWTERVRLLRETDVLLSGVPDRAEDLLRALDPFERALVSDRFRAEARDLLAARAFDAPLPARLVVPVDLAGYDMAAERLLLASDRFEFDRQRPIAQAGQGPDGVSYRLSAAFALPTGLPVPRAQAQALITGLALGAPRIALEFDLPPLRDVPPPAAEGASVEMPVRVQRAVLYADPELRAPIHEFPQEAFLRREVSATAGPVPQLQPATRRQVVGTVLRAGGPDADAVRDEIARRTPSHGLVRPEMRATHAEELADRYRRDAEGAVLWLPAQIDIHDVDPGGRRASIAFAPEVGSMPRGEGLEGADLPLGLAEGATAPRATLVGALPLDDEMLRQLEFLDQEGGLVFRAPPPRRLSDLSVRTNALVRVEIAAAEIGAPLHQNGGPALRIVPEIREVHLQLDGRSWGTDGRLLVRTSVPVPAPDLPASAQGIVVVRHAENAGTRPTGLLVSCLDPGLVPRALQDLAPVAMADTPAAVARFFSELADAPVAWVTRADCLVDGREAVPEGRLVHRPIHGTGFAPVETLPGMSE